MPELGTKQRCVRRRRTNKEKEKPRRPKRLVKHSRQRKPKKHAALRKRPQQPRQTKPGVQMKRVVLRRLIGPKKHGALPKNLGMWTRSLRLRINSPETMQSMMLVQKMVLWIAMIAGGELRLIGEAAKCRLKLTDETETASRRMHHRQHTTNHENFGSVVVAIHAPKTGRKTRRMTLQHLEETTHLVRDTILGRPGLNSVHVMVGRTSLTAMHGLRPGMQGLSVPAVVVGVENENENENESESESAIVSANITDAMTGALQTIDPIPIPIPTPTTPTIGGRKRMHNGIGDAVMFHPRQQPRRSKVRLMMRIERMTNAVDESAP